MIGVDRVIGVYGHKRKKRSEGLGKWFSERVEGLNGRKLEGRSWRERRN